MKKYFITLFIFYSFQFSYSQTIIDSLKFELKNSREDTSKVKLLNYLAWKLRIEHTSEAVKYLDEALEISKKINFKKGTANLHHTFGSLHYNKGDYPQAFSHHFQSLQIRKQLNNKENIAISLGAIGIIYMEVKDFTSALKYYFQALEIYKEIGIKSGIAKQLGNIGIIYKEQRDYENALKCYFEALEIEKERNNKIDIAINLGNIGNVYVEQSKSQINHSNKKKLIKNAFKYYF